MPQIRLQNYEDGDYPQHTAYFYLNLNRKTHSGISHGSASLEPGPEHLWDHLDGKQNSRQANIQR